MVKKLAPSERKALDGKGPRREKGQQRHCFRGVKGGLTANGSSGGWHRTSVEVEEKERERDGGR